MPLTDYFEMDRFQSLLEDMVEAYGEKLETLDKYDKVYLLYRLSGDLLRQVDPEAEASETKDYHYPLEERDSNGVRHRPDLFDLTHDICATSDEADLVQMMRAIVDFVQEPESDQATRR